MTFSQLRTLIDSANLTNDTAVAIRIVDPTNPARSEVLPLETIQVTRVLMGQNAIGPVTLELIAGSRRVTQRLSGEQRM